MGNRLTVQLDLDRVETEGFAAGQRYEYRDLRIGRIQQLLLKLVQFRLECSEHRSLFPEPAHPDL